MNSRLVKQIRGLTSRISSLPSPKQRQKVWHREQMQKLKHRDQMQKFQNLFNGSYKMRKQVKREWSKPN